jgi:hypothetical protein
MVDKFQESFEKITQAWFYVGVTRFKDVRLFNYQISSVSPNLVGISSFVDFIEIENSVDLAFRVGRIGVIDSIDLRKTMPLMGNEVLYIEYNNLQAATATVATKKSGFFRVMSIEENTDSQQRNKSVGFTSRYLILTIAEFPYVDMLTFNTSNKSYAWDGGTIALPPMGPKPIASLVSDMFTDPTNREITTTMGISYFGFPTSDILPWNWINYYSPNWSKIKNINYLKRMATTLIGGHSYYYINCEGSSIKFKSIYQEFLSPLKTLNKIHFIPVETYNMMPTFDIAPLDSANVLMDVSFKMGNVIGAMFNGFSGSTDFSFDYLSGHTFTATDYRSFKMKTSSNDLFYINFQKFGNQDGKMSYSAFNAPIITDNVRKYEYAKKSFNSMVCEATTFISNGRYLGQCAHIVMPSASTNTSNNLVDPIMGENWCIWGYKDIISNQRGICKLTLKKDSTFVPYYGLLGSMLPTPAG